MPLPPLVAFALLTGLAAALADRHELRMSPRPILLTRGFAAYLSYALLVVVPISVYFYVFHGDWFLLYAVDVSRVPSAVALIGFIAQACLGVLGFLGGAILVRAQREVVVAVLTGVVLIAGVTVVFVYLDRLGQVGNYDEFHRQFGLESYEDGPLLTGALAMGGIAVAGLTFLLARLWMSNRTR